MCLALPGTSETGSWGHPNFRAGTRTFAACEPIKGRPSLAFRVGADWASRLLDRGIGFATPYGRGQWISLWADGRLDWRQVAGLVDRGYRLVAPSRAMAALDRATPSPPATPRSAPRTAARAVLPVTPQARGRMMALVRGINVSPSTRVAMADLRDVFVGLGCSGVRTVLNSGNVVFSPPRRAVPEAAVEAALAAASGVRTRVVLLTADEVDEAVSQAPDTTVDPSKLLVVAGRNTASIAKLRPLARDDWSPEVLALGTRVAYLVCVNGAARSRLWKAVEKALGDEGTARNLATMRRLAALVA